MYKTIWLIIDETETETTKSKFTYYHFGKAPQFPKWYFEENHTYTIEMLWNVKLLHTIKIFFKCLLHKYNAKNS